MLDTKLQLGASSAGGFITAEVIVFGGMLRDELWASHDESK